MDILLIFRPNNEKRMCVYTKASLRGNMAVSCISAPSVASSEALSALRTELKVGCFSVGVLEDTLMCPINVDFGEVVKPLNDKEICHISQSKSKRVWMCATMKHFYYQPLLQACDWQTNTTMRLHWVWWCFNWKCWRSNKTFGPAKVLNMPPGCHKNTDRKEN